MPYDEDGNYYFGSDEERNQWENTPEDNGDIQGLWDQAEQTQWERTNPYGYSWDSPSSAFDLNKALTGAAGKEVATKGSGNTGYRSTYGAAKNTSTGIPSVMSTTGSYTANQLPTYKTSTLLAPETFTAPLRDTHKVAAYTQEAAAPGFAKLNRNANSIAARVNDPYSPRGRTTLRAALAGVGEGYGSVIEGAGKSGLSRYNSEYDSDYKTALLNNQSTNQFRQAQNQNTMQADQANYQAELNRIWQIANAAAKETANEPTTNSMWG